MATPNILPAEVALQFKHVKGAPVAFFDRSYGDIDLKQISLDKAAELVDAGCPHLERLKKVNTDS